MTDWENIELGNICEVVRGGSPRPIIDYITDEPDGVNWLKIGDVKETDKFFTHANEKIKPSGIPKTREVKAGDLILSNSMSFGRAFITLIDGYIHDGWLRLRCDESRLDKEYLYYFLTSNLAQNQFKAIATGSVVNNLKSDTVKAIKIDLPTLVEQKRIAEVLSMFDDKIKCNEEINKNLEEQVSVLYQSWFEDFEITNGVCPENWSYQELSTIADIASGKRPPVKSDNCNEKTPISIVGAASVMGFTSEANHTDKILVTGRVGTHGVVQRFNTPCWTSDNTLVITSPYYEFTNQILHRIDYSAMNRGSTQPLITQGDMKKVVVLVPDENTLAKFEEFAGSLMLKWEANNKENVKLASLRDTLLPKLMSGELDASNLDL